MFNWDMKYKYIPNCRNYTFTAGIENFLLFLSFFFFFFFLGPNLQHVEVPRLGANQNYSCRPTPQPQQWQDLNYICDLHHSSRQCWIPHPVIKVRDQTSHPHGRQSASHHMWTRILIHALLLPAGLLSCSSQGGKRVIF